MTRYGFAIKALPKGAAKPFGEDDEDEETPTDAGDGLNTTDPGALSGDPGAASVDELPEASTVPDQDPNAPQDPAAAAGDTPPSGDGTGQEPADAPEPPEDDSRPWAGDEYNEGDETDPDGPQSWSAFSGSNGEQAWLDKAPDGTLTGWVRDSTGQVWRYTDPDAWALDVDGAQMTQTHHNGENSAQAAEDGTQGGQAPEDRGRQDLMFAGQ